MSKSKEFRLDRFEFSPKVYCLAKGYYRARQVVKCGGILSGFAPLDLGFR